MLNVRYYKDYRHNYLIMEDNGALTENVYQRKMISENKIKGLLPVSESISMENCCFIMRSHPDKA